MALKFPERGPLNLPALSEEWLAIWDDEKTFEQSVTTRPAEKPYVFFEGPPSANGKPGIHHVMARAIKDIFCRFQTLKGHRVERKADGTPTVSRWSLAWRRNSASPRRTSARS